MRKLKVYGGNGICNSKQTRAVVAACSMKEVAAIVGESLYYISNWWCETGNEFEVKLAMNQPHLVFYLNGREIIHE